MDFDDFLNELGAASPSLPSSMSNTTSDVTNHIPSNNFSIDDDELDDMFASITGTTTTSSVPTTLREVSTPIQNVQNNTTSAPLIKASKPSEKSDVVPEIVPIIESLVDSSNISSVVKPERSEKSELVKSEPEQPESNVLDIFDSMNITPPKDQVVDGSLVGVSSSKILESMSYSQIETDTPSKYSVPPRSLMDVFNATYVDSTDKSKQIDTQSNIPLNNQLDVPSTPTQQPMVSNLSVMTNTPSTESKSVIETDFMAWLEGGSDSTTKDISAVHSITDESLDVHIVTPPRDLLADVKLILNSSFPDIIKLRQLLQEYRTIPTGHRCHIWNILLTGSSIEDLEAKYYHFKDEDKDTKNFVALLKDVDIIAQKFNLSYETSQSNMSNRSTLKSDLIDIISLYCLRKNTDYNPLLLQLLVPLAIESSPFFSKTVISSSFYNFIDNFIPLSRLNTSSSDIVLDKIHFWLRLLVGYHSPKLLQHLDRVVPGWELPCRTALSPTEIEQARVILRNTSNLDRLERDLGLDSIDDPFGWTVTAAPFSTGSSSPTAWSKVKGVKSSDSIGMNDNNSNYNNSNNSSSSSSNHNNEASKISPKIESSRKIILSRNNNNSNNNSNHSNHTIQSMSGENTTPASDDTDEELSGFIAHNWIAGNFAGSLPPAMALAIYDWAILFEEKYAGLFLIASLLEISSDMLITMNAVQIKAWFQAIAFGQDEWYKLLPTSVIRKYFSLSSDGQVNETPEHQWTEFITGWLHVTAALRRKTTSAFIKALKETEEWAKEAVLRTSSSNGNSNNGIKEEKKSSFQITEDDDFAFLNSTLPISSAIKTQSSVTSQQLSNSNINANASNTQSTTKTFPTTNLMAQFNKIRQQFQLDANSNNTTDNSKDKDSSNNSNMINGDLKYEKIWPHDLHNESQTLCLWSDSLEVVSSLTANRRKTVTSYDILRYFDEAIELLKISEKIGFNNVILPRPEDSSIELPYYFGIDCRTADEKRLLGVFPRTYAFDPALLSDSDEVTKLLETLDPLASSVHLCIIGAGEEFYKWHESYQKTILQQQQQKKLWGIAALGKQPTTAALSGHGNVSISQQNIVEERSKLNSLAMFFLKKSFRHVSVLEGGFAAALRQIYTSQATLGLSNYLIDSDIHVINSLLGFDSHHIGTVIAKSPKSLLQSNDDLSEDNLSSSAVAGGGGGATTTVPNPPQSSLASIQKVSENIFTNLSSATNQLLFPDNNSSNNSSNHTSSNHTTLKGNDLSNIDSNSLSSTTTAHIANNFSNSNNNKATVQSNAPSVATMNAKEMFSGFTRKLTVFGSASLETIKKSVSAVATAADTSKVDTSTSSGSSSGSSNRSTEIKRKEGFILVGKSTNKDKIDRQSAFVIDDEEDEEDDQDGRAHEYSGDVYSGDIGTTMDGSDSNNRVNKSMIKDTHGISIRKTENEKQHALILHKLAGLSKGDQIEITRDYLPGAILFPCHKYKYYPNAAAANEAAALSDSTKLLDLPMHGEDSLLPSPTEHIRDSDLSVEDRGSGSSGDGAAAASGEVIREVHRYLVVTKERFMVLDADGGGVGSKAIVKSNHHLTELIKMTFRKKNPELVTLFFMHDGGANKSHKYRVPKKQEFVNTLQKNMQRFK